MNNDTAPSRTRPAKNERVATHEDRLARARQWFEALQIEPTEQQVTELAKWVHLYRGGTTARRYATKVLSRGQTPTPWAVRALIINDIKDLTSAATHLKHASGMALGRKLTTHEQTEAVLWVAQYWVDNHKGPGWYELGDAMGWDNDQLRRYIQTLLDSNLLAWGGVPRALRPYPAAEKRS